MTLFIANVPPARRAYDHRLREHVVRCGPLAVAKHVHIPRSAVSTWRRRGLRPVVSAEPKPTVGVGASRPNEIWHVDTSVIKLIDSTKVYLQAVVDNFSCKILAWAVTERFDPSNTCQVAARGGQTPGGCGAAVIVCRFRRGERQRRGERHLVQRMSGAHPGAVRGWFLQLHGRDVLAFSEASVAFPEQPGHGGACSCAVEFYVAEHNTKMPHSAFGG